MRTSVRFSSMIRPGWNPSAARTAASAALSGATSTRDPGATGGRAPPRRGRRPSARPTPCRRCAASTKIRSVQPPGSPSRQKQNAKPDHRAVGGARQALVHPLRRRAEPIHVDEGRHRAPAAPPATTPPTPRCGCGCSRPGPPAPARRPTRTARSSRPRRQPGGAVADEAIALPSQPWSAPCSTTSTTCSATRCAPSSTRSWCRTTRRGSRPASSTATLFTEGGRPRVPRHGGARGATAAAASSDFRYNVVIAEEIQRAGVNAAGLGLDAPQRHLPPLLPHPHHRRAEGALAPGDLLRRADHRHRDDRAGHRLRPGVDDHHRGPRRRPLRRQRLEDVHHQRHQRRPRHHRGEDRPDPAPRRA